MYILTILIATIIFCVLLYILHKYNIKRSKQMILNPGDDVWFEKSTTRGKVIKDNGDMVEISVIITRHIINKIK
jgi:hypothetical protein